MTRAHRRVHGIVWPIIFGGLVIALVFVLRARTGPAFAPITAPSATETGDQP